jgi:hypothetical protein
MRIYKIGMVKRDNYGKRNRETVQEKDKKKRKKGEKYMDSVCMKNICNSVFQLTTTQHPKHPWCPLHPFSFNDSFVKV